MRDLYQHFTNCHSFHKVHQMRRRMVIIVYIHSNYAVRSGTPHPNLAGNVAGLLGHRQVVLVSHHLELLEALRYPLVCLQEFLHAVEGALVLRRLDGARGEIVDAVGEAQLRQFVVRQQEVGELLFFFWQNPERLCLRTLCLFEWQSTYGFYLVLVQGLDRNAGAGHGHFAGTKVGMNTKINAGVAEAVKSIETDTDDYYESVDR